MAFTRRKFLVGSGSVLACAGAPIGAFAAETAIIGGPAFGTSWRITLPGGVDVASAKLAVEKIIHSVDVAMSPFRADSEISLFNGQDTAELTNVSPSTGIVVKEALRIANLTQGAFDPSVGPIVQRYGFGPITNAVVGNHTGISITAEAITKVHPSLSLDLCGIAKGYALGLMADAMEAMGTADFLIELGGEVFARGRHPDGRAWQLGVQQPIPGSLRFQHIIELKDKALATSGDAVNGYDCDGLRYGHIVDPRTRAPVRNGVASVSVLARCGMKADAMATALMVMGPEQGAGLAEQEKLAALFIVRDGDGLREIMTGDFADHILV